MGLPVIAYAKSSVTFDTGESLEVHGLSRGDTLKVDPEKAEPKEVEINLIASGTDLPIEEVRAWYNVTPSGEVEKVIREILTLSGLAVDPKPVAGISTA